jgi:hypothetical protein
MVRTMLLWVLAAITAPASEQGTTAKTVKAEDLSDAQMEAFLAEGEVGRTRSVGAGSTGSMRATLRHDGVEHDVHIQSIDQTTPVSRMVGGVEIDFRDTYRNNVAAYRLDRLLRLGMVPVTVVRSFQTKKAAFTWWVDDVAMTELQRRARKVEVPDVQAWNRQMYVVRIFDQLIYNFDRNLGNLLIDSAWRLWMIDHTRAFKVFKEIKTPQNLGPHCPRGLLETLRRLDRPLLERTMSGLLTSGQSEGLLARRDHIVAYFDARVAELGEGEVLYDLPPRVTEKPGPPVSLLEAPNLEAPASQGIGRRPSERTVHWPSSGKPGAGRDGAPSHPAAIIATAVSRPPLPGR